MSEWERLARLLLVTDRRFYETALLQPYRRGEWRRTFAPHDPGAARPDSLRPPRGLPRGGTVEGNDRGARRRLRGGRASGGALHLARGPPAALPRVALPRHQ